MQATLRIVGVIGITLTGCSAGGRQRQDALWREYRQLAPARDASELNAELFADAKVLERTALVSAVLARNPSVAAAREGLRAALAEVPQASAFPDPTVAYELAPLSVTGDAHFGQAISVRQRLPFPGKRRIAAQAALAAAEAEAAEIDVIRLELAQVASELYDDYYVVDRALEINAHHRMSFEQIKKSAEAQYIAGRAAQQDPIQAEVELAQLERDRIMLDAERDQIAARLNGLLHRLPDAALPPPPEQLAIADAPSGTSRDLQALALSSRPHRAAARARIRRAEANVEVAERAFYPDVELMGSYNSMWAMPEHRWMLGVMVEVPLQRGPRRAAVDAALAQTAQARFEDERVADDIRVEVDRAHRRLAEAEALVTIHEQKLVPAARAQVDAARAGFTSARNPFLAVVEAQNNLRELELRLELSRAELSRRRATLARAVGVVPGTSAGGAR
jgi:outer membrane protein, heavy metal efflux system